MWVVCVWKVWFHKWAYVFYRRQRKYILSNKEKRYSFSNEWKCRWDWKRCCAFYHQRVNLSSKKFYLPKANLFCRKWRKSRVWHDSRVIVSTDQKSVFTQLVACSIPSVQIVESGAQFTSHRSPLSEERLEQPTQLAATFDLLQNRFKRGL